MGALGFHQYLPTLPKIDLFMATVLIIFHKVPLVYVVLFLQSSHQLIEEDNGWTKGFRWWHFNISGNLRGGWMEKVRGRRGLCRKWRQVNVVCHRSLICTLLGLQTVNHTVISCQCQVSTAIIKWLVTLQYYLLRYVSSQSCLGWPNMKTCSWCSFTWRTYVQVFMLNVASFSWSNLANQFKINTSKAVVFKPRKQKLFFFFFC